MARKQYFVYIATNLMNTVLYIGVTNDLIRRGWEHKSGFGSVFTKRYKITKIIYYEAFDSVEEAIRREKQLKAGSRKKKVDLIKITNPEFKDLYQDISD